MNAGDKVVCINSIGTVSIKKGQIYTIENIVRMPCCGKVSIRVNSNSMRPGKRCGCGEVHAIGFENVYNKNRFRPIEYATCHDELINELVIEKPDIKIEEPVL